MACEITYNNFEMSLVVFMSNITTDRAITYTYLGIDGRAGPPFSSFNANACKSHRKHYYGYCFLVKFVELRVFRGEDKRNALFLLGGGVGELLPLKYPR